MYSLLTKFETADLLKRQLPSLVSAMIIAEFFYKFHSFTLECVAFLATWFVIDAVIGLIFRGRDNGRPDTRLNERKACSGDDPF